MENNSNDLKIGRRIGDISDIPEELRNELQIIKKDELANQIIEVLKIYNNVANLDEILIGLYRKYNVIQKRLFISNKLYRMSKDDLIMPVSGKKGVYSIK
jgi:hypothetical protein